MNVLEVDVLVDAPRDRVWKVVSDPRNLPRWDRRVACVEGVPGGGLREGSRYVVELRFMGVRARAYGTVLALRPPEYARVRLDGLVEATVETWVRGADGGRTRLRHRVEYAFPGGPLGDLAARVVRHLGAAALIRRGVEAQKRQAEER